MSRGLMTYEADSSVLQQPWAFVKELGQGAYGWVSIYHDTLLHLKSADIQVRIGST